MNLSINQFLCNSFRIRYYATWVVIYLELLNIRDSTHLEDINLHLYWDGAFTCWLPPVAKLDLMLDSTRSSETALISPANADWSMHLLLTYQPATMRKDVPLILQTLRITVKHHTLWSRDIPQIHIQPLTHRFGRYSCSFCLRPPHALDFRMMQKPNAAPSTWMPIKPKTIV